MKRYFSPRTKKAIFFDLNHTLIDQNQSIRSCFLEVLNEFTGRWDTGAEQWDPEEVASQYEKKWSKARQTRKKSKLSLSKIQYSCLRAALKPYPFVVNDEFLQSFFKRFKQQKGNHIKLYPDTIKTLTKLRENYNLGIISNKAHVDLKRIGLSDLFTNAHMITSQKSGYRKPHPAVYKFALKTLNVKPSESVMVGNSWKNDIYGATQSGMDAVWIQHASKKKSPNAGLERNVLLLSVI